MKIKVFVLTHLFRTEDNDTDLKVVLVASTITKAKERFTEEKADILGKYEDKHPDNYEVYEDHQTFWGVTCKDEEVWDELLITEKEVDQ